MHLAQHVFRTLAGFAAFSMIVCAPAGTAAADRRPLVGSAPIPAAVPSSSKTTGLITLVDPASVPCVQSATFDDLDGGPAPGVSYDGMLVSGGVYFAERFVGQSLGYGGFFDVVSGAPSSPLALQTGLPGQNLNVFEYASNVLTGLGHIGFPDMDAIGEGAIAMYFPAGQSQISLDIIGGNGGWAQLDFYRADGTLIDSVVLSGLTDASYGFAMANEASDITGILIQTSDLQGIGIDNVCHEVGVVKTRAMTWGNLKTRYR